MHAPQGIADASVGALPAATVSTPHASTAPSARAAAPADMDVENETPVAAAASGSRAVSPQRSGVRAAQPAQRSRIPSKPTTSPLKGDLVANRSGTLLGDRTNRADDA